MGVDAVSYSVLPALASACLFTPGACPCVIVALIERKTEGARCFGLLRRGVTKRRTCLTIAQQ